MKLLYIVGKSENNRVFLLFINWFINNDCNPHDTITSTTTTGWAGLQHAGKKVELNCGRRRREEGENPDSNHRHPLLRVV